jgi:chemotaxis family two-component system response regulator Rcp1
VNATSVAARIFLAEDNRADVFLLREALSAVGQEYVLQVAEDGESAMRELELRGAGPLDARPELIVLDLNLPKLNGRDILRRVRTLACYRDVPIVVLTSSDSPSDRGQAEALGASAYIQKPPRLEEFLKIGDALMRFVRGPSN